MKNLLSIIILEDENNERKIIEQMITNRISINPTPQSYDAKIVLSTGNPQQVLDYVSRTKDEAILAYLDIDLKTDIDGIEVASRIKNVGLNSQTVFVTADASALALTIQRHVAPLDYVTKDSTAAEIQNWIYETLDTAYHRYQLMMNSSQTTTYFTYSKIHGIIERIPLEQVYYLEILPKKYKKLRIYAQNKIFDCKWHTQGI